MAEFSGVIDKSRLPRVKEVCRDFAVLEDHCLAHSLQEQEIESHLASNVHKSRLVQKDLQVAKRLQEEEDLRAKAQKDRRHKDIERSDNEMAQEIQEQLVRQAEQQRKQEEKDEAMARKMQEREMKEEKKRQKQQEANFEEEYYEEKGARRLPSDLCPARGRGGHYDLASRSVDYSSPELGRKKPSDGHKARKRYAEYEPPEASRSRYPDSYPAVPGRGKNGDRRGRGADQQPPESRARHSEYETSSDHRRGRGPQAADARPVESEAVVRKKEKPPRPPQPRNPPERDKDRHRSQDKSLYETWDPDWDRHGPVGHRGRDRYRGREREGQTLTPTRPWSGSDGELAKRGHHRATLGPRDGSEEPSTSRGLRRGERKEALDLDEDIQSGRPHSADLSSLSQSPREKAPPAGRMVRGGEYGLREASQGLARMDLREQELRDMEVARRMQEEELKANQLDVQAAQAAQVAQDEEIARLWMEEEKRMYKKSRDKEKLPMEKRRPEGDWKPAPEEMMQPRSRDEYEYQRARNNKPARPPTRQPIYENISYAHQESPYPPHPASRPDSAYKGAYYRQ
ncbi:coiled-coil domain-containing protein 50-like isoform X1 [Denticeps clupeoides]|uniref:Coiled-coil domain-containing protein n=1 Tax=Denticeps clupeoides TaxID=299321 RepID=A0AAY4EB93_9TELE|nr:coiled-coil domain-containing protein 50-like isoform X1 [Denticeps clupeoides]